MDKQNFRFRGQCMERQIFQQNYRGFDGFSTSFCVHRTERCPSRACKMCCGLSFLPGVGRCHGKRVLPNGIDDRHRFHFRIKMVTFGYCPYPVKVTVCNQLSTQSVRLYFLHMVRLYFLHMVRLASYTW